MSYQSVFKRYEIKYLVTQKQKDMIINAMKPYMKPDKYGRSIIRNIYYDTDNFRLIRHSLSKPVYKEKLRIRSYSKTDKFGDVFVELKKKYDGVVYKRRISLPQQTAMDWLGGNINRPCDSQIAKEIDYFRAYYKSLHPVVFLTYEREAYYSVDKSELRITFDENILCRRDELFLGAEIGGEFLLDKDMCLMEIKTSGAIPLWMVKILSQEKIYKSSFSKYGTAYEKMIFTNCTGGYLNA